MAALIEAEYLLRRLRAMKGACTRWLGRSTTWRAYMTGQRRGYEVAISIVREEIAKEIDDANSD